MCSLSCVCPKLLLIFFSSFCFLLSPFTYKTFHYVPLSWYLCSSALLCWSLKFHSSISDSKSCSSSSQLSFWGGFSWFPFLLQPKVYFIALILWVLQIQPPPCFEQLLVNDLSLFPVALIISLLYYSYLCPCVFLLLENRLLEDRIQV